MLLKIVSCSGNNLSPSRNQAAHGMLELNQRDGVEDCINLAAQLVDVSKLASFQVLFDPTEQPVICRHNIG